MEHKYTVTGKIKTGKRSKVDFELSKFPSVTDSLVTKTKFTATLLVHFDANLIDLQNEIGGDYSDYKIETFVLVIKK